jgi:predicted transcriptional regulator
MTKLSLTLPKSEADRLAQIAARHGVSIEEAATAALVAQLDDDGAARAEIEAGLAELDAGSGVAMEDYEREMDALIEQLNLQPRG